MRRLIEYIFGPTLVMEEPGRDPTFDPQAYKANRTRYGVLVMIGLFMCGACCLLTYAGGQAYASTLPTRTPSITPTGFYTPTPLHSPTATPTLVAYGATDTPTPVLVVGAGAPHIIPSDEPDRPTRTATPMYITITQIVRVNVGGGGGVRNVEVTRIVPATVLATVVQTRLATVPVEVTRIVTRIVTQTLTRTPIITATLTITPTASATPTLTMTATETPTPTLTMTPTFTPTPTPTETATPTPTETETATPTLPMVATETPTPALTMTPAETETAVSEATATSEP